MDDHIPYRLFANCIPVKGAGRSTICDLQRNRIHLIPNSLFDLLQETKGQTPAQIKAAYQHDYDAVLDEYFHFLEEEELIFQTNCPKRFPDMDLCWEAPSLITNAILDLDERSDYDIAAVIAQLDACNCKYLELRSYSQRRPDYYRQVLTAMQQSTIISVTLLTAFDEGVTEQAWLTFCDEQLRLTSLTIHSSNHPKTCTSPRFFVPVTFLTKNVDGPHCCGVIGEQYFVAYTETFTEALQHNSCLNRKVSIDAKGLIRNCPSIRESFGHIKETSLQAAMGKAGFRKYWDMGKDKVTVCKDCEFRYVCSDCRAYLEQPEDDYSKPLKCGYDPYTCTWEEWSTHPMKQQGIDHYRLREILELNDD